LAYVKGIDLLAAAFRTILKTIPQARLIIVGSGEEEAKLRGSLNVELMERVVHIESDVDHDLLPEWYRAMDLFVMPSRYENYSNAVLESLACGVPFLVSDVGGNRRLVETQGGWIFTQESVESLVQAMNTIAKKASLARERGGIGGKKIRQMHSWEASAKQLEQIIQSCLRREVGTACRY
jgi:glycosyltransferase involved in cell wall biosynthesis